MAGRKTKYTPDTVKAITDAISLGLSIKDACLRADISDQTYLDWCKKHLDFLDAVQKAETTCKLRKLARIEQAGQKGTWQADAWVLERKFPDEFAQQINLKLSAEQRAILKKHGLTPMQAMEQLINALDEEVTEDANL